MADTTTTTQVPPAVAAFYDKNLLERAVPANIHGRFGQQRNLPKKSSSTIKFRRYSALAAATTALTEGVTPSGKQLGVTDLTAQVAQYGDFVEISDAVNLLVEDKVLVEAGELLGEQAGLTLDTLIRNVLVAGTNVIYANGAARNAVNTAITMGAVKTAIRTLKRQNAKHITKVLNANTGIGTTPIRAGFVGLVHPDVVADIEGLSGFVPVAKYPNPGLAMENEIGSVLEVRFIESTNAKVFADAGGAKGTMISTTGVSADVYATIILSANAYGVVKLDNRSVENIVKGFGSAGTADPLNQRSTSGWKAWHVSKILNDAWMVRMESAATEALS